MSLLNQVLQDLEKRHASETELKSVPPNVRAVPGPPRPPLRAYAIAAMVLALGIALAFFLHGSDRVVRDGPPPVVSNPIAALVPFPGGAPNSPAALPQAQAPAPAANPVSRLADDVSRVAPASVQKEKTATAGPGAKPGPAVSPPTLVRAPAPQAEKSPAAAAESATPSEARTRPVAVAPGAIDKQMRDVAPSERAEIAFRKGAAQLQAGRANVAESDFREALKQDPSHAGAGQALLGLLLDSGRNDEAEALLRKALEINPRQPHHAMVLARLEVERGEVSGAIDTMVGALAYVQSDPDFHAFLAALLQRVGRHREAVEYYRTALRGVPGNGVWMMGLGISLRAADQSAQARDTFQRAIESKQLTPELQEFVERQLRELSAQKKK